MVEQFEEIPIPEIEEKTPKNYKPLAAAAGVFVVLAAVIAVIVVKVYGNEKRALIKAMQNLAQEMEERQELWEAEAGGKDGIRLESVLNMSAQELPITLGVDTVLLRDGDARRLQASTAFSVMNNKLLELEIYGEEDTIVLALPAVWQQNFVFDEAQIDRQYNDSLLAEKWGKIDSGEISLELFPEKGDWSWSEMIKRYQEIVEVISSNKKKDSSEIFSAIEIEKLEGEVVIGNFTDGFPDKGDRQYRCSQYRIQFSGSDSLIVMVDENERIVQISLEEPFMVSGMEITGSVYFLGEERSIDDIVVNMQAQLPLDILPIDDSVLSAFGNKIAEEIAEKKIEIQLDADIVYDENDTSVVANLDRLTASVDRIGTFKVSGSMTYEPLREEIEALSGETIRIFEITEEEYKSLEQQLQQKLWKWSIAAKLFGL